MGFGTERLGDNMMFKYAAGMGFAALLTMLVGAASPATAQTGGDEGNPLVLSQERLRPRFFNPFRPEPRLNLFAPTWLGLPSTSPPSVTAAAGSTTATAEETEPVVVPLLSGGLQSSSGIAAGGGRPAFRPPVRSPFRPPPRPPFPVPPPSPPPF